MGDPPAAPAGFDDRYVLPPHCIKPLQQRHVHERDREIDFIEEPHIYTWQGKFVRVSVTYLAHLHEQPFDADLCIERMQRGRNWPRLEYVKGCLEVASVDDLSASEGNLLHDGERVVAYIRADDYIDCSGIEICTILQDLAELKTVEGMRLFKFEDIMTPAEIKAKWSAKGLDARNRGTEAHLQLELWNNSLPCRMDDPEVIVGLDFVREHLLPQGVVAYNTEKEIYLTDEDCAGSIDYIGIKPNGHLIIVDWKRSPKLQEDMHSKYGKMKAPFNHLPSCK